MRADGYIEALGRAIGEKIDIPADGKIALMLGNRGVLLLWQDDVCVVHVEVGPLLGWRDGEVCKQLLSANFLLRETDGGALSYNPVTNMVGLNCPISLYGLEPQGFPAVLDRVLALGAIWQEKLLAMGKAQEDAAMNASRPGAEASSEAGPGDAADEVAPSMHMLRV